MAYDIRESHKRRGSRNAQWQRIYERTWIVETDDKDDGPVSVMEAVPVRIGDIFRSRNDADAGSYCQAIDADCDTDGGLIWTVVAHYGPLDINAIQPQNPTERPIKVSWSFSRFERVVTRDLDDKLVVNSAGDPFDPPLVVDDSRPVLTIVRNELNFDPLLAYLFKDATNADPFWGVDPGIVKVLDISDELNKDPDIGWYNTVTYQFEFNPDGWSVSIPDLGYRELDLSNKLVMILDNSGVPATVPQRLNGQGSYLSSPTAATKFLDFNVYKKLEFAVLNLDPSMIPRNPS